MDKKDEELFLVRSAGIKLDEISFYTMSKTLNKKKEYDKYKEKNQLLRDELAEELFLYISQATNDTIKNICLNLKRNIHNERVEKVKKSNIDFLPCNIQKLLGLWIEAKKEEESKREVIEETFINEIEEIRKKIKQLCVSNIQFLEGILIANFDLFNRMKEYIEQDEIKSRKLKNTEISLTNYISRMAYKPSPFASFSGVSYGKLGRLNYYNNDYSLAKSVRINISVLKYVENKLLNLEEFFEHSFFAINSTCTIKQNKLTFIDRAIECGDKVSNLEQIKSITLNEIIQYILNLFMKKSIYTYSEICDSFSNKYKVESEKINVILKQFIEIGLLQNFLIVPNQDYFYLNNLYKVTKNIESKVGKRCHEVLGNIISIQNSNSVQEQQIKEMKTAMLHLWEIFSESEMPKGTLVFEDTALKKLDLTIEKESILQQKDAINEIKAFMTIFDDSILQKIALNIIFEEENAESISLFHFYKKYSATDKIELWRKIKSTSLYKKVHQLRKEVYEYLLELAQTTEDAITISKSWMKSIIERIPSELLLENKYSIYFQIAYKDGKTNFVINKMGPGNYRHFSRYLNLFQENNMDECTRYIINRYRDIEKDEKVILMDLNAILGLNINIHSHVLDTEFTYPRSCPNPNKREIQLDDIIVHKNYNNDLIGLYEKESNRRIEVLPLGFLFSMIAPHMYAFLSLFSRANGVEYSFWGKLLAEKNEDKNIQYLPRLYYQNIVIDRKTWCVGAKEFHKGDSVKDFIANLQVIKEKNIDHEVFVRASSLLDSFEEEYVVSDFRKWMDEVKNTKLRKPQFINFESFFHQKALIKILSKCEHDVLFQEVFPDSSNTFCNKKRVMEFLME